MVQGHPRCKLMTRIGWDWIWMPQILSGEFRVCWLCCSQQSTRAHEWFLFANINCSSSILLFFFPLFHEEHTVHTFLLLDCFLACSLVGPQASSTYSSLVLGLQCNYCCYYHVRCNELSDCDKELYILLFCTYTVAISLDLVLIPALTRCSVIPAEVAVYFSSLGLLCWNCDVTCDQRAWWDCIILTTECSHFPCLSVCLSGYWPRGGRVDGWMEGWGGWAQGSPPLALLCCHLLPHSRPEVVGVLLTCNPSHCLAAGSRVTRHSKWHESALTPADLSHFSHSVNRAWVHGPLAGKKKKEKKKQALPLNPP